MIQPLVALQLSIISIVCGRIVIPIASIKLGIRLGTDRYPLIVCSRVGRCLAVVCRITGRRWRGIIRRLTDINNLILVVVKIVVTVGLYGAVQYLNVCIGRQTVTRLPVRLQAARTDVLPVTLGALVGAFVGVKTAVELEVHELCELGWTELLK